MPTFGQIKLPSGNIYDLADNYARQLLAGGLVFEICWDGQSAPDVSKIPAGVKVVYGDPAVEYTGTKAASTAEPLHFYLVFSPTQVGELDHYDEYAAMRSGAGTELDPYVYTWEKIGDTRLDLSNLGALAYKDNVTLNKGAGVGVLGSGATFSAQNSAVSFSGGTDDSVLGADTTFIVTQPNISVTPSTSKMVQTTVPNVTNAGSPSTFSFAMGDGVNAPADCLVISGSNSVAPTLGTAITVATGALDANGAGASVATGISSASASGAAVTANSDDRVTAVTNIGTGTAAAQNISVASADEKTVAAYSDLSVTVS